MITAESGKIKGGEMHKSRIIGKEGEDGLNGAMRRPNWQLSVINLLRTLSTSTIGGKR